MGEDFSYIGQINNMEGKKVNTLTELYHNNIIINPNEQVIIDLAPIVWLKAETINQANRTRVASWTDSSGNNNNATQATLNNQPFLIKEVLNGYDVVRFNENNTSTNYSFLDILGTVDIKTPNITLYCVMRNINAYSATYNCAIAYVPNFANFVAPYAIWSIYFRNDNRMHSRILGQTFDTDIDYTKYRDFYIYKLINMPIHGIFANGNQFGRAAGITLNYSQTVTNSGIRIGQQAGAAGSERCGLDIAEIIFFNYTLTQEENDTVEKYLSTKYNIYITPYYIDNFNNYLISQESGFNKGVGFNDSWTVKNVYYSLRGLDNFNYTDINSPLGNDSLNGFSNDWTIKTVYYSIKGLETFESYINTTNMNGGMGFNGSWAISPYE